METFSASRYLLAVAAFILVQVPIDSRASTLLDTMPPNIELGPYYGLNNVEGFGQSLAVSFSIASAATVDSVATSVYGGPGSVTLGIMNDVGGLPSNAFLFSADVGYPSFDFGFALLSDLSWGLAAGSYWLAVVASDGGFFSWVAGSGGEGIAYTDGPATNWVWDSVSKTPGVQITGTVAAIPEPESYAMLLAGLGLLAFIMRRRRLRLVA